MRCVPLTVQSALDAARNAVDVVDMPVIYEVQVKYVEILGQIESVKFESSSFECIVDDGTGRITLKQYFGTTPLSHPYIAFQFRRGARRCGRLQ